MVLMKLFAGQQGRETQRTDLQTWSGGRKERVRCMERVTWKLTLPYVKQTANGNLLCVSGNSNRALYQPRGVGWPGRWKGGSKGGEAWHAAVHGITKNRTRLSDLNQVNYLIHYSSISLFSGSNPALHPLGPCSINIPSLSFLFILFFSIYSFFVVCEHALSLL